jgi:hypothetical protein
MSSDWIDWNEGMGTHDGNAINDYNYWEGDGTKKGQLDTLKDLCASDLAQFQEMLGIVKGADGKDVKPDPGLAILFFITVMLPHMMDLHSAKVEEYADQMTELRHILEGITKMKDLANQAKTDPSSSITQDFIRLKDELKAKIQNDSGWLKGLGEGTQKAFADIDDLLNNDSLFDIWREASGDSSQIPQSEIDGIHCVISGDTMSLDCPNSEIADYYINSYVNNGWVGRDVVPGVEPHYDPQTKKITFDLSSLTPEQRKRAAAQLPGIAASMKSGAIYWFNNTHNNPDHNPDNTKLKTLLTAFDTLTTSSNNLSTDVQGDMKVETGTYDQFLTVYHDMAKEFISEIKKPIDKQE